MVGYHKTRGCHAVLCDIFLLLKLGHVKDVSVGTCNLSMKENPLVWPSDSSKRNAPCRCSQQDGEFLKPKWGFLWQSRWSVFGAVLGSQIFGCSFQAALCVFTTQDSPDAHEFHRLVSLISVDRIHTLDISPISSWVWFEEHQ